MSNAQAAVFRELLRRELSERHQGSFLGIAWLLLLPLLQLAVLAIVFGELLPARASVSVPYPVFLAFGLYPWLMFANAVNRALTAYTDNRDLIGKVAITHSLYVHARVVGSMLIDLAGWLAVLIVLHFFFVPLPITNLVWALPAMLVLIAYAVALSRLLALMQVFVRDFAPAIGQILSLGFFLTPVLYVRNDLPEALGYALSWNPFTAPIESIQGALLGSGPSYFQALMWSALVAVLFLLTSIWLQARARPHLEDFL